MRRFVFVALLCLTANRVFAQQQTTETGRLLATGKLWITIKYFHPYLAYRDIDWDKALIDALPKIRVANSSSGYAEGIASMLDVLHDPATYVEHKGTGGSQSTSSGSEGQGQRTWVHDPFHSAFYSKAGSPEILRLDMGEDVVAVVRLSEPISDTSNAPPYPSPLPDKAYQEMRYPAAEYRILAAYKIWGIIHYFFAYRDLMDEDWDDLLPRYLSEFIAAKDSRAYNLLVAEMITHVTDSHAIVQSEELAEYFGKAPVGLRLRLIEKKPLVTAILDPEASKAGIQVGDIVSKVDGESVVDRFNREAQYIPASTPQSHGWQVMQQILNGAESSKATVTIGGQDGRTREVTLTRSSSYFAGLRKQRSEDVVKLLPGNLAYADLDRLSPDQVDSMFEKCRDAKAVI
ncbi:MAG: hypothetical protein JO091_08950, partial [Acidobacteriaceae bacterium]|nr:hypothetical protein [Acidobacteriaceae bacterium]